MTISGFPWFLNVSAIQNAELRLVAEMGEFKSHSIRINVELASVVQARQKTYKKTCIFDMHACVYELNKV